MAGTRMNDGAGWADRSHIIGGTASQWPRGKRIAVQCICVVLVLGVVPFSGCDDGYSVPPSASHDGEKKTPAEVADDVGSSLVCLTFESGDEAVGVRVARDLVAVVSDPFGGKYADNCMAKGLNEDTPEAAELVYHDLCVVIFRVPSQGTPVQCREGTVPDGNQVVAVTDRGQAVSLALDGPDRAKAKGWLRELAELTPGTPVFDDRGQLIGLGLDCTHSGVEVRSRSSGRGPRPTGFRAPSRPRPNPEGRVISDSRATTLTFLPVEKVIKATQNLATQSPDQQRANRDRYTALVTFRHLDACLAFQILALLRPPSGTTDDGRDELTQLSQLSQWYRYYYRTEIADDSGLANAESRRAAIRDSSNLPASLKDDLEVLWRLCGEVQQIGNAPGDSMTSFVDRLTQIKETFQQTAIRLKTEFGEPGTLAENIDKGGRVADRFDMSIRRTFMKYSRVKGTGSAPPVSGTPPGDSAVPEFEPQDGQKPLTASPGASGVAESDVQQDQVTPPQQEDDGFRTWTDLTGSFKVDAEFVSLSMGKVKLRKKDGDEIEVPREKLSEQDQQWLRDRAKSR